MLINTHKILANNILRQASNEKVFLLDKKKFVWGNLKPDCVSKYKFKKHFYDESIEMILEKINFLSTLTVEEIYFSYGRKKFSAELGVICHFICDFFCLAHNRRWRLKSAFKKHMMYEQELNKIAKRYEFKKVDQELTNIKFVKEFIEKYILEYENLDEYYEVDLDYSFFICSNIINLVLETVLANKCVEKVG